MNEIIYCPWEAATFWFFSSNVPLLVHYSHIIAVFAAMSVSLLVFFNNPKSIISRLFLLFSTLFSIWAILDVLLWATNDPGIVMFAWSLQVLIEPITFLVAFFLFYIFLYKKIPPFWLNSAIAIILLPLIILLPTTLNLEALQLSTCESIEGPIAKYYTYILNFIFVVSILFIGFKEIPKLSALEKKTALYFGIGLVTFLLAFTSGNIVSSFTDDWTISQYGLFGMPVFAFLIAYSIVQFKAFKIQIAGAQILVVVLWALVASLLFVDSELLKLIAGVTLIFTTAAGYLLITSVRQEFKQKLELEQLTFQLEKANKRLRVLDQMKSEFVSIASHQLRSPLTSIRGYASMLLDGTYGKISPKAADAIERIADSSKFMALSVEDYLNVSRIESGNMKYEKSDFNLKDMAEKLADDMRREALKKGLVLVFKSEIDSTGIVNADIGKTRQIIHNLVDNALKYTEKGNVKVTVSEKKRPRTIMVTISDTGIGMSADTLVDVFGKFERAHNANSVNVSGTGLGLYIARKMAQDMGGDVTATSPGEGKGSSFTFSLPLEM